MKNKKVYSHVQLRIYFPDGCRVEARFLPNETISVVKQVVSSAFLPQFQIQEENKDGQEKQLGGVVLLPEIDFELYISPPRKTLNDSKTLADEGLVPAAKIFVSWKSSMDKNGSNTPALLAGEQPGYYLQRHLFPSSQHFGGADNSMSSSFPESRPINEKESIATNPKSSTNNNEKASGSSSSREEEMIMKMMGKKKKGGLFGNVGGGINSNKGGGKPKWFKG